MNVVDFHNHVMPGVDDGAQDLAEALEAIRQFQQHGVRTVVATPHVNASLTLEPPRLQERLAELDAAFRQLAAAAGREFPELQLLRGCELQLDVPEPDLSDARLRLNGGSYFLMEFPFMTVLPRAAEAIGTVRRSGYVPVLAHPERYSGIESADAARAWKRAGALLQVNGGSLLGRYGPQARKLAHDLLRLGLADFICSDYHARGTPQTLEVLKLLTEQGGEEQAMMLTQTNPRRMLEEQAPLPVLPLLPRQTLWGRMSAIFR